jgi:hypothetical protein
MRAAHRVVFELGGGGNVRAAFRDLDNSVEVGEELFDTMIESIRGHTSASSAASTTACITLTGSSAKRFRT